MIPDFPVTQAEKSKTTRPTPFPWPFDLARVAGSALCSSRYEDHPADGDPMFTPLHIARGHCLPLGASSTPDGVNFVLLCRHGTAVFLVLYPAEGGEPLAEIALHPKRNRTGDHWHILV